MATWMTRRLGRHPGRTASAWWRWSIVAVGLVAASAVGWPLGGPVMAGVLICSWLPVAAWSALAVRGWPAVTVAAVLIAAVGSVHVVLPGRPGDRTVGLALPILALYALGEAGVVVAARCWRRPRGGRPWRRRGGTAALMVALVLACCVVLASAGLEGAPTPSPAELLPLPGPLKLLNQASAGCGADGRGCDRSFLVVGPPGVTREQVLQRLRRHLAQAKGWGTAVSDGTCRLMSRVNSDGWLVICVEFFEPGSGTVPAGVAGVGVSISTDVQWWSDGYPDDVSFGRVTRRMPTPRRSAAAATPRSGSAQLCVPAVSR